MIATERLEFAQAFNRLAVSTRLATGEADAAMQQIYWDGLEDLPIDAVSAAAESLAKASVWFPKVAEWREASYAVQIQERLKLPPGREEPWHYDCEVCEDSGWEYHRCYAGTGNNCGRRQCMSGNTGMYEHNYVTPCSCRETNRTYQRQRAILRGGRAS